MSTVLLYFFWPAFLFLHTAMCMANSYSSGNWQLKQALAMTSLPLTRVEEQFPASNAQMQLPSISSRAYQFSSYLDCANRDWTSSGRHFTGTPPWARTASWNLRPGHLPGAQDPVCQTKSVQIPRNKLRRWSACGLLAFLQSMKSNLPARRPANCSELANRCKEQANRFVMALNSAFQIRQFSRKFDLA